MLTKIISGGQTGADIAAIDAAIANNFSYGGMIPKGRKCETGIISYSYDHFVESTTSDYLVRTEENVDAADGTLVFTKGKPTSGTAATIRIAKRLNRWYMLLDMDEQNGLMNILQPSEVDMLMLTNVELINIFIETYRIRTLNVAGPRESKTPGMYKFVFDTINAFLQRY